MNINLKEGAPNFELSLNGIMTIRGHDNKFFYFERPAKPPEVKERGEYIHMAKDHFIRGFLVF